MTTPEPATARRAPGPWVSSIGLVMAAFGVAVLAVVLAQQLREVPEVRDFIAQYPGDTERPDAAPIGFPAWLAWQHFLNGFLLVFLVRTGWQIRSKKRPPAFRIPNHRRLDPARPPRRVSVTVWFHLVLDVLWAANGVLYVVLLFVTGQWMRLVPLSWDVVPNAISVGIQYVSLDWPAHDGWVHYNALQLLLYGATVFLAAPLALVTGLRLSPAWKIAPYRRLGRLLPERPIRTLHGIVMFYVVAFTVVHVTLVLTTGAVRNLNHIYAIRDDESWIGVAIFGASLAAIVLAWVVLRPAVIARLASVGGTVR